MKYFQKLLLELHDLEKKSRAGTQLTPPSLLRTEVVDGMKISYMEMGLNQPGPTILFLHGFGGFFMDWPRIMIPMSRHRNVIAIDLPGWGFSEAHFDVDGLEYHVEAIDKFVRQKGIQDAVICGISYGAAVAWGCGAHQYPWLKKLLLLNPMPPFPLEYLKSFLYKLIFKANQNRTIAKYAHRFLTKTQYKLVIKENLKNRRLLETFYLNLGFKILKQPSVFETLYKFGHLATDIDWKMWEGKLRAIDIPTGILQGSDDKVFTMRSASYLHSLIPSSKLVEVPDSGHAMVFDQHRVVLRYIRKNL